MPQPQQHGSAQQHDQSEGHGCQQQRDGGHGDTGERPNPGHQRHVDRADPLGVLGGDVGEFPGQPAFLGAASGVEHAVHDRQPECVRGLFGPALTGLGAEPETPRQRHVHGGQDTEPERQPTGVLPVDGLVDDDTDEHRHQGFPQLVHASERRTERDTS